MSGDAETFTPPLDVACRRKPPDGSSRQLLRRFAALSPLVPGSSLGRPTNERRDSARFAGRPSGQTPLGLLDEQRVKVRREAAA